MEHLIISLTEKELIVKNREETVIYDFSKFGISIFDTLMCGEFIKEIIVENYPKAEKLTILLSEHFTYTSETFVEDVKMSDNNDDADVFDESQKAEANPALDSSIISSSTDYLSSEKAILNYNAIPVLSKYYKRVRSFHLRTDMYKQLKESLLKLGIKVRKMIPIATFYSCSERFLQDNSGTFLSVYENNSFISIIESGNIIFQKQVNSGIGHLIQKISDYFNISVHNAGILLDKYGFVFLPSKFNYFVIDIPIYNKIMKEVELPELSFIIREEMKTLTEKLLTDGRAGGNRLLKTGNIYSSYTSRIRGFDKLIKMTCGTQYIISDFINLDYDSCITITENAYILTNKQSAELHSKKSLEPATNKKKEQKQEASPSFSKAFNFLEKQMNLLLES